MTGAIERQDYSLVPADARLLEAHIRELRQRSAFIAGIAEEAFEQCQELHDITDHFKDISDEQLAGYLRVQTNSVLITPPVDPETVSIGTVVNLVKGDLSLDIEIAGTWHDRHMTEETENRLVQSCETPLVVQILGKVVGDFVEIDNTDQWRVNGILPSHDTEPQIQATPEQCDSWRARRMLFIVGPHGAGKTEVIKSALDNKFAVIDTGPILRDIHRQERPDVNFKEWIELGERLRGSNFANEVLAVAIRSITKAIDHPSGIVVIGNRSVQGIDFLKQRLNPSDSRIVYVQAPKGILYIRFKDRERRKDMTLKEFDAILQEEMQMGLLKIESRADYTLLNTDTLSMAGIRLGRFIQNWSIGPELDAHNKLTFTQGLYA